MASSTVKIVAIVAVVAVVIAAVAIFVMGDSDDEKDKTYDIEGALPVMGNADKDYDFDNNDLDIIDKIIANESGYTFAAYPFADANNDKQIDEKDREIVQKIINKEPVRTWVINTDFGGNNYIDYFDWPAVGAVSAGYSPLPMLYRITGVMDFIKGITLSQPYWVDPVLYPELVGMKSLGPDMRQFDLESVKECKEKTGASVIICTAGLKNEQQMKDMGMSIVRPACIANTVEDFTSAMLLMGFLFDYPTQSLEISEWYKQLRSELDAKLDGAPKTTCITLSSRGVWNPASTYGSLCLEAGGDHPQILKDNPSGSFKDGDWIYQMDDCEYIMELESSFGENSWFIENNDKTQYVTDMKRYTDTTMYLKDKIFIVAYDLPMPLKIMYTALGLHPELFTEQWADGKAQEFFDKFMPEQKIDVGKLDFFLDAAEIKALM